MSTKNTFLLSLLLIGVLFLIVVVDNKLSGDKEPIKIGLVTTLTGPPATSGTHSRNGVLLATEEINNAGGINGHLVELIIKDDKGSSEESLRIDRELIESGVTAILGHFLSTLAVATVPLMNEEDILMIGLGTITSDLSNIDDNFIRVAVPVDIRIPILAEVLFNKFKLRKMAVVYDIANPNYSKSCFQYFEKSFKGLGGEIVSPIIFNSKEASSMVEIAEAVAATESEGLLLITQAIHGAIISQHVKYKVPEIKIADSGWAISDPEFIAHGGSAVNGVVSVHQFNEESKDDLFVEFENKYEDRFGSVGGNTAQRGYEAAKILFYALSKTRDPRKLKKVILDKARFKGIDGDIVINEFGDPVRVLYVIEIQEYKIRTIDKIDILNF